MPNAVTRFQILSKTPNETADFYSRLFGWSVSADNKMGYREINTGSDKGIHGGIWPAPPTAPDCVQLFIAVDNVAASVKKAEGLGAKVIIPVTSLPDGDEIAVMQDPHGMPFGIFRSGRSR